MADLVVKLGVKRDPDFMYYMKKGDLWRVPRAKAGRASGRPELAVPVGVKQERNYIYFLDANGDIARALKGEDDALAAVENEAPSTVTTQDDEQRAPAPGRAAVAPRGRRAAAAPKSTASRTRRGVEATEITQRHNKLQNRLVRLLRDKYGDEAVRAEENNVDITVDTGSKLVFIEVKSDRVARLAIREALGQLLEYAFRGSRARRKPRLVVAAPAALQPDDERYLRWLRAQYKVDIRYLRATQRIAAKEIKF